MLHTAPFKARLIALAGLAAVTAVGAGLWHTDLLVARGFGKALEGAKPTLSFQPAAKGKQVQAAIDGDEGYWLTRAEFESPTSFVKPLALGDRITISGGDGTHQFEIVDLKAVGTTLPVATTGQALPRLLIVTCRSIGENGKPSQVRFIVEADAVDPGTVARPKTL